MVNIEDEPGRRAFSFTSKAVFEDETVPYGLTTGALSGCHST